MNIYDPTIDKVYMSDIDVMRRAGEEAHLGVRLGLGGPFGAAITKGNELISVACNTVLKDNDPTAHAEINAIRYACKTLKTHDLSGCEIYATGSPCPMCLSAIMWANIKKVHVSGLPEDAAAIGFRDKFMYEFIEDGCKDTNILEINNLDRDVANTLYEDYSNYHRTIY